MKKNTIQKYHYTESGLDSVYIYGLEFQDDEGEKCVMIKSIDKLHACIAMGLLMQEKPLDEKAIYFLRAELEMSEKAIKQEFNFNPELNLKESFAEDVQHETLFRSFVAKKILPTLQYFVEDILEKIQKLEIDPQQKQKSMKTIEIDAQISDTQEYRLREAA